VNSTYQNAGVNIAAQDEFVERIKPLAAKTRKTGLLGGVGGFGGLFELPKGLYQNPVLVSGTDGVGTKLKLAFAMQRHETVGIDLVAMSVNDVLTLGARPLFFLDYFATSRLELPVAERVISGIVEGCLQADCCLLGGETAELPGFYSAGDYELAGFCVGIVEKSDIVDGREIQHGDAIVGLASSGLHSNGYSLARKIVQDKGLPLETHLPELGKTLGEALLEPTRIYVREILSLMEHARQHKPHAMPKGMAHITGGGIPGNLPRCLPAGTQAVLHESHWQPSPLFGLLAQWGNVLREEMYSTFNMGLGYCLVIDKQALPFALEFFKQRGLPAWHVGHIEEAAPSSPPMAQVLP
jgi:phosphoribosylformylglycinamidine cyclo-ligase